MRSRAWCFLVVACGLVSSAWSHGQVNSVPTTEYCVGTFCAPSAVDAYTSWAQNAHSKIVHGNDVTKKLEGSATCNPGSGFGFNCSGFVTKFYFSQGGSYTGSSNAHVASLNQFLKDKCPDNGTMAAGGKCDCKAGTQPSPGGGNQCEPIDCDQVAGDWNAAWGSGGGKAIRTSGGSSSSICVGGCNMQGSMGATDESGVHWNWGPWEVKKNTAGAASTCNGVGNTGNDAQPAPNSCQPGTCPGSVNGSPVCAPCKPTEAKDGDKTTTKADGSSTKTTTKTECADGKCKTTKVTEDYDADGNPVPGTRTTEEEEKTEKTFCEENPKSPLCKESSFSGACDGGYQCEGDAITCAIAREQHKRACEWADVDQGLVDEGNEGMAGGIRPDGHPFADGDEQSFSLSSLIDQTPRLSAGCPVDLTVGSVTLPFSSLCTALEIMGSIAVGFSLLFALRIVFG